MKDYFECKSRENGLPEVMGKDAYPLHKIAAENMGLEKKYGENGFSKGTKMSKKY